MATWQNWVEDKVKDALTSGEQHSYYHLLPQRNPNDPVDTAVANAAGAIGNEASKFRVGPLYQPSGAFGSAIRPAGAFAPPEAIRTDRPTMDQAINAGRKAIGLPMPTAVPLDEAMTRIGAMPSPTAKPSAALVNQPGDFTSGGRVYSGAPPTSPTAIRAGEGAAMPTQAITGGNELTRWDMARGLQNAGVNVPMMSREEMARALSAQPGQGGIANLGTMPDNQLRDLMDRRGLSYFKMNDDQMRALWKPIEEKNMASRPQALFTGGDFGAGPAQRPTYQQALQTALQMFTDYAKNPDKYGPHYAQNIISAIQHLPVSEAVPGTAAAEQEYKRGSAEYARAHATLVPSEIAKNEALASHYTAEGKNKPFVVPPGYEAYVPSPQIGNPATKIATGATEKAGTPGAIEHMSEGDKIMLQGAWHALGSEMDPEGRKMYQGVIDSIYGKYNQPSGGGGKPQISRDEAYKKLKERGLSDKDANAYLDSRGFAGTPPGVEESAKKKKGVGDILKFGISPSLYALGVTD